MLVFDLCCLQLYIVIAFHAKFRQAFYILQIKIIMLVLADVFVRVLNAYYVCPSKTLDSAARDVMFTHSVLRLPTLAFLNYF